MDEMHGTFACPICGQDFPHSSADPLHEAAVEALANSIIAKLPCGNPPEPTPKLRRLMRGGRRGAPW